MENTQEEIWKDILELNSLYQVSNKGNIRVKKRIVNSPMIKCGYRILTAKLIKTQDNHKGYKKVTISLNGKKNTFMAHRLVAKCFIENPLNKEQVNIVELIKSNIEKHQMASEKKIHFTSNQEIINCEVDIFHFENTISNLLDNAIKYGGSNISIDLIQSDKQIEITVEDNGIGIDKTQREKIFDQFYRIPKGNIHDVKGFGIGLFYAKKIIEKHS